MQLLPIAKTLQQKCTSLMAQNTNKMISALSVLCRRLPTEGSVDLRKYFQNKKHDSWCIPETFKILGWCPAGSVLPHGEKVPL